MIIEKICKRYGRLQSEVLNEDQEWIEEVVMIMEAEIKRDYMQTKRQEQMAKIMK